MGQKPDYIAYVVKDVTDAERKRGKKPFWMDVGAAWTTESGNIAITLHALPVTGKVILKVPESDEEREARLSRDQE